ncbi:zinc finger CCCH domain-containing protein 55 isoform X1 [Sesbania bispinosa]|nr:zinc finger CCCH domain-containing protein 55 isoform X1 [Sesbania bispinosa]
MGDAHFHRRSYSASDACFGFEEGGSGIGYKPCLYFARGFCKTVPIVILFMLTQLDATGAIVGSPNKFEGLEEEFMRLKAAQQHQEIGGCIAARLELHHRLPMTIH